MTDAEVEYITGWINEHGTESQKGRHAERLLAHSEAIEAIAASAFSPLQGSKFTWPDYKAQYPRPDCDSQECCADCKTIHQTREFKSGQEGISEAEYQFLLDIRQALPKAVVTAVLFNAWHDCEDDNCGIASLTVAKVELHVGPLTLTRYYKMPKES
jgi:hypothetical protein